MKMLFSFFGFALLTLILSGCATNATKSNTLHLSQEYYNYLQPTFTDYLAVTHDWLAENRDFISDDHQKELGMNMPFELKPTQQTDKAILLVHGLSDSPFSFSDLANSLVKQGFYVQVLLLPGHGSKPDDMMLTGYQDWQNIVDHYAGLLKQEYGQVWLGGFSTGGNLVTIHALDQGDIEGLLLFSPGFQSVTPKLEKFTPLLAAFWDGYKTEETNLTRYNSAPLNGAIAYSRSASILRQRLKEVQVKIPTLISISEADSIIDANAVKRLFKTRFNNPKNQLIWYGKETAQSIQIKALSMMLAEHKISTGSHMSPIFAPSNTYYGEEGEMRICENGFESEEIEACLQGEQVWFSAWGYHEVGKVHARLTWNPYYSELEQDISRLTH